MRRTRIHNYDVGALGLGIGLRQRRMSGTRIYYLVLVDIDADGEVDTTGSDDQFGEGLDGLTDAAMAS